MEDIEMGSTNVQNQSQKIDETDYISYGDYIRYGIDFVKWQFSSVFDAQAEPPSDSRHTITHVYNVSPKSASHTLIFEYQPSHPSISPHWMTVPSHLLPGDVALLKEKYNLIDPVVTIFWCPPSWTPDAQDEDVVDGQREVTRRILKWPSDLKFKGYKIPPKVIKGPGHLLVEGTNEDLVNFIVDDMPLVVMWAIAWRLKGWKLW